MSNAISMIREENSNKYKNVGNNFTLGLCMEYYNLGFDCTWNDGKDLTLIRNEKELSDGHLKSSANKNMSKKSISHDSSANKNNYSTVCRRCGRKLRSEVSKSRGYGSYCYKKAAEDAKKNKEENEEFEGQNFLDEVRGMN